MPRIDVLKHGSPMRANEGVIGFCSMLLIEGEKRILVDVGHVGRRKALLAALSERGLTPADIDMTVMTHAHWDHAQNFDLFDHAPTIIHEWELRYVQAPHPNDWATPQWTGAMVATQSNLREVQDGEEIDPGVRILHTPGHTAGSISVQVDTDEGSAVITGDVLHTSYIALTRENPLVMWSEEGARRSIDRVIDNADIIYPGHDRPFRLVNNEKVEYLAEPVQVEFGGLDPELVTWDQTERTPWIMPGIEDQKLPD